MGISNPHYATDAARCEAEGEINAVIAEWVGARSSEEVCGLGRGC
jgi:hypothetical protein